MLESEMTYLVMGVVGLFLSYTVAVIVVYYIMCIIEWVQEIKNNRRK